MAGPIDMTMPPLTEDENYEIRKWLALSHEDGKCHIYGDDGELQCGNIMRHGRCLDFRRETITALLDNIYMTRMREYTERQKEIAMGCHCDWPTHDIHCPIHGSCHEPNCTSDHK